MILTGSGKDGGKKAIPIRYSQIGDPIKTMTNMGKNVLSFGAGFHSDDSNRRIK